jgi:preprotein translocase subunit SecG
MTVSLMASLSGLLLGWLMGFLSLFLILLILIQRGKGGGLTGALGGPGGQSAFGSKAGDTFTVITIVVASFWGFTCAFTMWLLGTHTPSTIAETSISAGPGDEDRDDPAPTSTFNPDDGLGGFSGLSVGGSESESATTGTPSADLPPTTSEATTSEATEAESTGTDSPGTDSTDDSATETPASGESEPETPASDTSESETPAPETAEPDEN